MAETHQEWLNRLEQQSQAKQKKFMNNISGRLGHPLLKEKPIHPFRGAPDFWRDMEWTLEERIEKFTDHFESVGGYVERVTGNAEASAFIAEKAAEMSAAYIVRQDEEALAALRLEDALPEAQVLVWNSDNRVNWKAQAAAADFGIVQADHAVAYTGSVVLHSAKEKGRSVSLLPTVLFILIPVERLKTRLGEVLKEADEAGRKQLPAGIHYISGPSRSSDIENDLTIGVHGPGIVYALLMG